MSNYYEKTIQENGPSFNLSVNTFATNPKSDSKTIILNIWENTDYRADMLEPRLVFDNLYFECSTEATKGASFYCNVYRKPYNSDDYISIFNINKSLTASFNSTASYSDFFTWPSFSIQDCEKIKITIGYTANKGIINKNIQVRVGTITYTYRPLTAINFRNNDGSKFTDLNYLENYGVSSGFLCTVHHDSIKNEYYCEPFPYCFEDPDGGTGRIMPFLYENTELLEFQGWSWTKNATEPDIVFNASNFQLTSNSNSFFWKDQQTYLGVGYNAPNPIPYIDYIEEESDRKVFVTLYAVWKQKHYVYLRNTIAPQAAGYIDNSVQLKNLELQEEKASWAYDRFKLQSDGYWLAKFSSSDAPAKSQICSIFSFHLEKTSPITIEYDYFCQNNYTNVLGGIGASFKLQNLDQIPYQSLYTSENKYTGTYAEYEYVNPGPWNTTSPNYIIHSGYKTRSNPAKETGALTYTLPPGDYRFFAYYQGVSSGSQYTSRYFKFKFSCMTEVPIIDSIYQKRFAVEDGKPFIFTSNKQSTLDLNNTKYRFLGWINVPEDKLALMDPSTYTQSSIIRGPIAGYTLNTMYQPGSITENSSQLEEILLYGSYSPYVYQGNKIPCTLNGSSFINKTSSGTLPSFSLYNDKKQGIWNIYNYTTQSSYNLTKVTIITSAACRIILNLNFNQQVRTNDYLYFSELNTDFSYSTNTETNYYKRFQGGSANTQHYIIYEIPAAGTYSFTVKFLKLNSYAYSSQPFSLEYGFHEKYTGIISDSYFYSIERQKYKLLFSNYPHQTNISEALSSAHSLLSDVKEVGGSFLTPSQTVNSSTISRTGYTFKGWSAINNTENLIYDSEKGEDSFFYKPSTRYNLYSTLLKNNDITIMEDTDYFYLLFYPVWNINYNLNFINSIDGLSVTKSVEKNSLPSFYSSTYSELNLTNNKYYHRGWIDCSDETININNMDTNIKGPTAQLNLIANKQYYNLSGTIASKSQIKHYTPNIFNYNVEAIDSTVSNLDSTTTGSIFQPISINKKYSINKEDYEIKKENFHLIRADIFNSVGSSALTNYGGGVILKVKFTTNTFCNSVIFQYILSNQELIDTEVDNTTLNQDTYFLVSSLDSDTCPYKLRTTGNAATYSFNTYVGTNLDDLGLKITELIPETIGSNNTSSLRRCPNSEELNNSIHIGSNLMKKNYTYSNLGDPCYFKFTNVPAGEHYFYIKYTCKTVPSSTQKYFYLMYPTYSGVEEDREITIGINSDIDLYSVEQTKYRPIFYNYPISNSNIYQMNTSSSYIGQSITLASGINGITREGYAFKGWTLINDEINASYDSFKNENSYFYSKSSTQLTENMINNASNIIEDTDYFNLYFYPVWNPKYNINFIIDYGSIDSNNKITKINSYVAEQGVGFLIGSSHLPSLPSNIGYSLQGWTEREPFDSNHNPNLNVIGPNATRISSTQYIEVSLNEAEFNSKKMSLYIYDTETNSYTLLIPDEINPSTISYDSAQTYYEAFIDLSAIGSSINKRKIYKDLTYYAILKKQYTAIFKDANGSTFIERSPQNINTTVSKPSTNPTLTYVTPNISYSASGINNYGFVQDSDGVWISQNGGHKQSYALGTFSFTAPASCCVMIEAECMPTNSYDIDIGYFSKLNNTNFSTNYNTETSTNYYVTSQYRNAGKFYVIYEIPSSGTYSFQVKYRRGATSDNSSSQDKLAFKINFINLNRSFQGWTLDKTDHSYETKLNDTDFYANNKSLPYVNDDNAEPANSEDPLVGPFTITYYPVFSKLYYLAFNIAPVQNNYWYPIQIYYNIIYKANQSYNSSTWPIGSYLTNGFNILSWTPAEHFGDQTETYSGYSASSGTISNITSNLTLYANQQRKYKGYFFKFFSDDTAYSVNSAYTLLNKSPTKPNSNPTVNNAIFKAWTLEKQLGYYYGLDSTNLTKVFTTIPNITSSTPYIRLSDGTFAIYYYGVWNPKYSITVIDELNSTVTHKEFCVEHGKNYALNNFTAPTSTNGYNMIGLRKINHYETPDIQNLSFTGDHFNFGFKPSEGEKNTWESTNQGQKNSYSYGKFYIQLNSPGTIEITAQNNSETNCDYGIFSQLDQDLSFGQIVDGSTKVLKTGKGIDTQYTCSYSIEDTNEHYITVKYIKDSSVNTADDKLKFSISLIDDKEVIGPAIVKEADDYLFSNTINNITENLILSVLWKKKYQVIFKKADGTNYSAVQNKLINDTITTPKNTDVTRTNYNLKGWTLSTEAKYQDYLTRDETNFYLPNTSVTIGDYVLEQDEDGYFNIIYYPVWIRTYKVTFKNSITNESKINIVEKKDNLDITASKALTLSTTDKGYDYLGWTTRNPSTTENVVGPTAERLEGDYTLPNNTNPQTISNITRNITLWAIAKKKYTLRFYKDNGSYSDKTYYYINSNGPSGITDAKTNYNFKGWTLDSSKRSYNSNEPIYTSDKVPIKDEDSEPIAENGAFYIYYYSVFNDLYTVSYYEYRNNGWVLRDTDPVEKGTVYSIQNITGIFPKTEYELIGWNTSGIFPNTESPNYNLYSADSNTQFVINKNVSLYTAWRYRYAIQIGSDDGTSLSTITNSFPSSQGTSGNIRYYNRNQTLTITLATKDDFHHCFKTYDYDEGENNDEIITVGAQNKTLTYTINLDPNIYNDNIIHKIHYSLGKAIKVTPIFNILSLENKDNDYYNNSFYLNTNLLSSSGNTFVKRNNFLEKEFTSEYYYPGDTISLVFSHQIPQAPLYEYYIDKIDFYKEGTYSSRKTLTESKDRIQLSEAISDNFTKYTYTYKVKLEDIQSTEKGIYIISCYIPYNNIIHIGDTTHMDLLLPQNSNQYTFHMWTGAPNTYYCDGYIYVFNDQSENCYVTITPQDSNGFIPTSFTYKDPSMNSNETISIYNFLDQEIPGSIWKNFYYNNKYTLNTIGIKLTPEDTSTYHEGLYELKMTGSTGYLQKVDIISKPISKLEITKAAETILEKTEENHLTFYINSSLLGENNTSYLVQDQKDSGLSFKEFKLDTVDTYNVITKSDIIDNNISLPSGWTRTESKDHTDIITYTNNNLSARNGYIDYVTITFDESLPLFYVDQKALQLYWENTKAEGLYWENIRLL